MYNVFIIKYQSFLELITDILIITGPGLIHITFFIILICLRYLFSIKVLYLKLFIVQSFFLSVSNFRWVFCFTDNKHYIVVNQI